MYTTFRQHLSSIVDFTGPELDQITQHAVQRTLRKRELVLEAEAVCEDIIWVQSGCIRLFLIDEQGREHIVAFATEHQSISDRLSLRDGKPSRYQMDAVEESEVVILKETVIVTLMQRIPAFAKLVRMVTNQMLLDAQLRITATLTLRAEDNYQHFSTMYPGLADRVPQQMIASYLGINAATLSRIRKKLALQNMDALP